MDTPTKEKLQKMNYSTLKKFARNRGIKGNMKGDYLIDAILTQQSNEDSFVTLEQQILNSSKKNKEAKFDIDKSIVSDTPRRETYTVETPVSSLRALKKDIISSSASPEFKDASVTHEDSLNVTMSRGSERKSRKRKVSFVTPVRRSVRLSHLTPHYASVRDRPKTPIPTRGSTPSEKQPRLSRAKVSFADDVSGVDSEKKTAKRSAGGKEKRPSTPMPKSKSKKMDLVPPALVVQSPALDPVPEVRMDVNPKVVTPRPTTTAQAHTPGSSSMKSRRTPNFSKIHQKAFDKLESIDEYAQRKTQNSAKKIKEQLHIQAVGKAEALKKVQMKKAQKTFGGIPFIPSLKTTRLNFQLGTNTVSEKTKIPVKSMSFIESSLAKKKNNIENRLKPKKAVSQTNTPIMKKTPLRKTKFDLQASLKRKLPYKPHVGPLKPINGAALNTTLNLNSTLPQKPVKNETVETKRIESRNVLRGVRKNRRFELQMQNRKLL